MTVREGNLEAPTRHPVAWRDAEFYDESALNAELARVFDICHGCRRCVSLCNAFPTLFDLVDATEAGEIEGVAPADYGRVVDQCYLCDVCYMTKCPYVPPHPWNVDFPHLMLRAKARKFVRGETRWRDRVLTNTDAIGKLATIPVVVQVANRATGSPLARKALGALLGVEPQRRLPPYATRRFSAVAAPSGAWPVRDGERTAGKVAIFSTCYINYNEPGIGQDLLRILDHNEIPYTVVDDAPCCGMPKLELGDFESVRRLKEANVPRLAALARDGYALLTPVPSCTLMFKSELPLIFPEDAEVRALGTAMYDPFEYLVLRDKDGLLKRDFKSPLGKVAYHIPCHSRVQKIGQKTREVIEWVPDTTVHTVERCAGHDGTWGVKREHYAASLKIGRPLFRQMAEGAPDYVSSDCPIAAGAIMQGIDEAAGPNAAANRARKAHPLTLIRMAYGL
jgi:Fe-S oxidoreductase